MRISKDEIQKLAIDEVIYHRGVRYFKNGAVSNVMWSNKTQTYKATVTGKNQHAVMVSLKQGEEISYSCNCATHAKQKGACKHVVFS